MAEHATSQVSLHPLVLINVSDHYTRIKVKHKGGGEEPRVFGVIFGVQNGMTVDIMESFEMVYTINQTTGAVNFDRDFLSKKKMWGQKKKALTQVLKEAHLN